MRLKVSRRDLLELVMISLGCCIYAFSIDAVSIPNKLSDGGISGLTLILRYFFGFDPGISTFVLNIPLLILGYRYMGKKLLSYTIYGTICLSFFLWFWNHLPIIIKFNFEHDLFISSVLSGLLSGIGIGLVFRFNGTTGGSDIIARIGQMQFGLSSGKTLLLIDFIVLACSLSYLDLTHMLYTLLAAFILSRVMDTVQEGAYVAKGVLIISDKYEQIAKMISLKLERGLTYLDAVGGYSEDQKKVIYLVISPREVAAVKELILAEDPKAFVTIFDVHEALGEGFSYSKPKLIFFRK